MGDEIVNGDSVHYFVHGRDKDLFEIRRDETAYIRTTTNNNQGPWRLHYKKKLSKAVLDQAPNHIVHHHIQVVGKKHLDRRKYKRKYESNHEEKFEREFKTQTHTPSHHMHNEIELYMKLKLIVLP